MKRFLAAGLAAALLTWNATAEDGPSMPAPEKEHEWLKQLAGDWDGEAEMFGKPGEPSTKSKGTESTRLIGGFWAMIEYKGDADGTPFTGILTVGYDPAKKSYVGTWIDSMTSTLWQYKGSVDAAGKVLTLTTEGPSPWDPAKSATFRESIEIKDKDHKTFTSKIEKDGEWITVMRGEYTRKK
ncbi:MAG: hypothetical protein FD180_2018 [Planctomycetota bacterium]|nr:MAG: hypothetical protein FD180_2018 [Planctomycetota bacterium]